MAPDATGARAQARRADRRREAVFKAVKLQRPRSEQSGQEAGGQRVGATPRRAGSTTVATGMGTRDLPPLQAPRFSLDQQGRGSQGRQRQGRRARQAGPERHRRPHEGQGLPQRCRNGAGRIPGRPAQQAWAIRQGALARAAGRGTDAAVRAPARAGQPACQRAPSDTDFGQRRPPQRPVLAAKTRAGRRRPAQDAGQVHLRERRIPRAQGQLQRRAPCVAHAPEQFARGDRRPLAPLERGRACHRPAAALSDRGVQVQNPEGRLRQGRTPGRGRALWRPVLSQPGAGRGRESQGPGRPAAGQDAGLARVAQGIQIRRTRIAVAAHQHSRAGRQPHTARPDRHRAQRVQGRGRNHPRTARACAARA